MIKLLTTVLCIIVATKFGWSWQTVAGCFLTCVLVVQSAIDFKYQIIPDQITLPVLWLGLILSIFPVFATSHAAILGAVNGYLILFTIYWLFYFLTKQHGMGYGDFKLLAMLGAWQGWQMLPFIVLFSSLVGSICAILLILFAKFKRNARIAFGPFLAIAGWVALLWGSQINHWYLKYSGIYL